MGGSLLTHTIRTIEMIDSIGGIDSINLIGGIDSIAIQELIVYLLAQK